MASLSAVLCRYGFHRASPNPVWNRGFWFSRCSGSGADLVRTAAGKWHVPEGRKIVWKKRGTTTRPDREERD